MKDMEYYVENYPCPKMSIIADCGFPSAMEKKALSKPIWFPMNL